MDDLERQLIRMHTTMTEGFRSMDQRFDATDNRLDQLNGKVGKAHDRAAKLEGRFDGLQKRVADLGESLGRFLSFPQASVAATVPATPEETRTEENKLGRVNLNIATLRYILVWGSGIAAFTWWLAWWLVDKLGYVKTPPHP